MNDATFIYNAVLDIPAWPDLPPDDHNYLRPMIYIMRRERGDFEHIIQISMPINEKANEDRWLVQFFDPEDRGVHFQVDLSTEKGPDRVKFRRPKRWEGGLGVGETRNPRATLKDAIALATEQLSDLMSPKDLTSLSRVIEMMKPTLESANRAYVQKWRPK